MLLAGSIIMFCMLTCIVSVRFYGNINITQIYMRSSFLCSLTSCTSCMLWGIDGPVLFGIQIDLFGWFVLMVQFCLGYVMKQQYKSQSLVLYNTNDTLNHLVSPHTKRSIIADLIKVPAAITGNVSHIRSCWPTQPNYSSTIQVLHMQELGWSRTICTTRSHHETMDLNTSSAVSGSKCASTCITELTGFTCTGLLSSCTPCFQYLLSKLKIHTSIAEGHEIS